MLFQTQVKNGKWTQLSGDLFGSFSGFPCHLPQIEDLKTHTYSSTCLYFRQIYLKRSFFIHLDLSIYLSIDFLHTEAAADAVPACQVYKIFDSDKRVKVILTFLTYLKPLGPPSYFFIHTLVLSLSRKRLNHGWWYLITFQSVFFGFVRSYLCLQRTKIFPATLLWALTKFEQLPG